MRKISLLSLVLVAACSPKPSQKVVTAAWMNAYSKLPTARVPANNPNPSCRNDLFSVQEVRREAEHFEKQLNSSSRVRGRWEHLDLSKLPVPQAKFLQAVGSNYGDLNNKPDVRECNDAVCVVNKVYKSSDGLEGWMVYLWYLKMGHVLSFKNKIYDQTSPTPGVYKEKTHPLESYLYSRDELYGFWRLSHALSTPFRTLPNMKEIQRIPRTASFEGQGAMVCGLAWSNGYVKLTDGCLSLNGSDKDSGFLYEGTSHELAHQIDYQWGRDHRRSYFSHEGTFAELGGWSIKEYLNPTTNVMERQWQTTLALNQFVRSYAGGSPAEHFADTAAYYRFEGQRTKRVIPQPMYQFYKTSVFESNEFDNPGLIGQFEKDVLQLLTPDLFQAAVDCDLTPSSALSSTPLPASHFPFNVEADIRGCLAKKVSDFVDQSVIEAKLNHVDGCKALKSNDVLNGFKDRMRSTFIQNVVSHITLARENQDYYRSLNEFYRVLSERAVPMQLMTNCYGQADERGCYGKAIEVLIEDIVPSSLARSESMNADLKLRFLQSFGYEQVKAENTKLHMDFLVSQTALLSEASEDIWKDCQAMPIQPRGARSEPIRPGPFSVGEGFMEIPELNCINRQIPEKVSASLQQMSFAGLGIQDASESRLLFDLAIPQVVKDIERFYQQAKASEELDVARFVQVDLPKTKQEMSQSFSWLKEGESFSQTCEQVILTRHNLTLRYHDKTQAIVRPISQACTEIMSSTGFSQWIRTQEQYAKEILVDVYIKEVRRLGLLAADDCRIRNSSNGVLEFLRKRAQLACFTIEWRGVLSKSWSQAIRETGIRTITQAQIRQETDSRTDQINREIKEQKF
jgi:hypothetical protein